MKQVLQFGLRGYQRFLSPLLPHSCRYVPTCSQYAMEAVELHGAWRGSLLALRRLLRCHPFAGSGLDPVPPAADRANSTSFVTLAAPCATGHPGRHR